MVGTDKDTSRLPLLLLPALLCDAELWAHQIRHLGEVAEPQVVDLTGGDSMADLAARVLALAPARFALAGISLGGYVAQEILRQAPDRVVKLALIDTNPFADTPEQTARRRTLIELARAGQLGRVLSLMVPTLVHPDRVNDVRLTAALRAMAERVGPQAYIRQQSAILARPDGQDDLARIRCPTLVLCGRQDALSPPEVHRRMAEAIPNGRLAIVEDCGHLAPLEQPQAVTALLRYWLVYG